MGNKDIDIKIESHLSLNEEYIDSTINSNNSKDSVTPEVNKIIKDLIPTNILSEPRFIAFGGGTTVSAKTTLTETMSKSTKNTSDKVDTVAQLSSDKKEGVIEDGYKETLIDNNKVNAEGVKALNEATDNIEGGNGVTIASNTEVQVSSVNSLSLSSGRVGNIQTPLLLTQTVSNIDYAEVKTSINNLQNTRTQYLFSESQRNIDITNKGLHISQSSEERTLRKSLDAVESYDETSTLIARNSQLDTTITDNRNSFVTNDDIQQAQKGGIHFMIGTTGDGGNSRNSALLRPVLPGEFNPQEQIFWSMTGGKIKATSTSEFNLKTNKSNTSANNIGLLAKETLASIAGNNGIYGDITTMIGKKALSTGTSLLSMTTMIGKFTFMNGFLSIAHDVLSSDISRIASIILPRIKIPTNLPIPPLPSKSSSYTEADLRKCLPDEPTLSNPQEDTLFGTQGDSSGIEQENDGVDNGDILGDTYGFTKKGELEELRKVQRELNKPKLTNNKTVLSSPFSGPPSSISWKEVQSKEESKVQTIETSSSNSSSSSSNQVQKGVDLQHKIAFAPNTYLEIYGLMTDKDKVSLSTEDKEPLNTLPSSSLKGELEILTIAYLNTKLKESSLSSIDKKVIESTAQEIVDSLKNGIIPDDLNDKQKELMKEILDSLAITVALGGLSIPNIFNPNKYLDGVSRSLGSIARVGEVDLLSNVSSINDYISNLKQGARDSLTALGKSVLQDKDVNIVKDNLYSLISNIVNENIPYLDIAPSNNNQLIIPPFNNEELSRLLTTYIMEPQGSIDDIEDKLNSLLKGYYDDVLIIKGIIAKVKPIIRKFQTGDILDLIDNVGIRDIVGFIGGDKTIEKIDNIIDNAESLLGTYRAIEAIPKLIKLLNQHDIPTLSKVGTIISCLNLADRLTDVIGIINQPFEYKPKVDIPQAITFFDDKNIKADIYSYQEGSLSSIYPSSTITSNFYKDTFKLKVKDNCNREEEVNIPKDEVIEDISISNLPNDFTGELLYPYIRKDISLLDFINIVLADMKEDIYDISLDENDSVDDIQSFIVSYKGDSLHSLKIYYQ